MARRLPPLKALRVFEAAARHASFAAAADELSIIQSAVSQQIRLLEDYLGQPLFRREARGATLLAAVRPSYQEVHECLDRIADAAMLLRPPSQKLPLTVLATPSLALKWLIPRLSDFQRSAPMAEVLISTQDRQELSTGQSRPDVVLSHLPLQNTEYSCMRCGNDSLRPMASPDFLARSRIHSPADCLSHALLHASGYEHAWGQWFKLALVDAPSQLPGAVMDHPFLCIQAAVNHLGIAMAPWSMTHDDVQLGRLQPVFDHLKLPGGGLFALVRLQSAQTQLAQQFVSWVTEQFRIQNLDDE
jgi:LysR family glycine cleavage system transcriptional activator